MSDSARGASEDAERVALERARRLRALFTDAADPMLILDDGRMILEANPAACGLFGVGADEAVHCSLDDLIADDADELVAAWEELLALGEARREHRMRSPNREPRLVECSYRARVLDGRHLCVARDITDRQQFEERLIRSERIESLGRLAGGIAHDFNNQLTAILGYTELLLAEHTGNDPERADLEEIQKAGKRAGALTQQLLAFSRKQVLVPKDVDLNQAVAGLQGMLARVIREDITLTFELSPTPPIIRIDPTQLEQAILTLVLNARDALPAGGHIRLEVARVGRTEVEVPIDLPAPAVDFVRLRVVDDGVGISPDVRAHLFEPFFTTKEAGQGTGLGLASVYGIVRQSHGFVTVESQPGNGSTFTMHFPVALGAAQAGPAPVAAAGAAGARETILLVEDEDAVRVLVGAVLRRQGYRVLEASTPRAACDLFNEHKDDIDLLLTDVIMPEVNGPALAQRLIGVRPELRVLFISGYAGMAVPIDADNPNLGFLSKPFRPSILTERVRQMLAQPGRTRAVR